MKIAILPLNVDLYQKHQLFLGNTTIAYLLSYLEKYFPEDLFYPAPDLDFLLKTKPDLVGISAPYSETFGKVIETARIIRSELQVPIILGGQHITYLPKSLPNIIDLGVIGEGEETFRDLLTVFKDHGRFTDSQLSTIPGIVFHRKGQKVITGKRKVIEDLDSIPLTRKFFYGIPGNWVPTMCTGRGTVNKVSDCVVSDGSIRLHSAERLIEDLIDIITFYPGQKKLPIPITDDFFLYDRERLLKFSEIMSETGLFKHVSFAITARPEYLTEEICFILKVQLKAVSLINLALVSTSNKTLKDLHYPVRSVQSQTEILERIVRYGFSANLVFSLGGVPETKEELARNYWQIRNNYVRVFQQFSITTELSHPYPGTEGWQKAIMRRLITENPSDWSVFNANELKKEAPLLNPLQQKGEFAKIFENYQKLNFFEKSVDATNLLNKKTPLYSTINPVFEHLVKNSGLRKILQITENSLFTLENIFAYNQLSESEEVIPEIENLSLHLFNKNKKVKVEKKYDCIVLFFTLDLCHYPDLVLDYCYQSLNKEGILLINFFNSRYFSTIFELLIDKDFSVLFHDFRRLHLYSLASMEKLLQKFRFGIKRVEKIDYLSEIVYSEHAKVIAGTLQYFFPDYKKPEFYPYTYTLFCRKI